MSYSLDPRFLKQELVQATERYYCEISGSKETYFDDNYPDFVPSNPEMFQLPDIDFQVIENDWLSRPTYSGFPIFLTHDIDYLSFLNLHGRFKKVLAKDAPTRKRAVISLGAIRDTLIRKDYRTFQELVELNLSKERAATYFMVSDYVANRSYHDAFYRLDANLFLNNNLIEYGIHAQWSSHRSSKSFEIELNRLNQFSENKVVSNRFHHLFFHNRKTPNVLANCGIRNDFTLGFNKFNGYRRNTSIPILYKGEDGSTTRFFCTQVQDLVELRHGSGRTSAPFKMIEHCAEMGTPFTLLWHNCWQRGSVQEKRLEEILEYAESCGGFYALPSQYMSLFHE